jgi:ClpP class serine protease
MVKERRGAKLADDPDLFTGMFWTGKKGLELGLIDALGDMRSHLKQRYGEKTKLQLVSAPRGFFSRRIGLSQLSARISGGAEIAAAAADGLADAAQERALWARLGL